MTQEAFFNWLPGQPLQVVRSDEPGHWTRDWEPHQVLYFAGWTWDVVKGHPTICVADRWPTESRGDLTDEWDPIHLTVAPTIPTTVGQAIEQAYPFGYRSEDNEP